jgi:hypothetical protein
MDKTKNVLSHQDPITLISPPPHLLDQKRLSTLWDKIDKEVGVIFSHSESTLKTPKQRKAWSPALTLAGAEQRYWKMRLAHARAGRSYGVDILRKSRELNITDDLTNNISELQTRHDKVTLKYEQAATRDDEMRSNHLMK